MITMKTERMRGVNFTLPAEQIEELQRMASERLASRSQIVREIFIEKFKSKKGEL